MVNLIIINTMTARFLFMNLFDKFEEQFPFIQLDKSNWYLDSEGYIWTDGALENLPNIFVRIEDGLEVDGERITICETESYR